MVRIGVTYCGTFERYANWVSQSNDIEVVQLRTGEHRPEELERCAALVLTGGEDVHPRFYGQGEKIAELDPREINEARDEFEFALLERARKLGMPILGICRGLQVANVAFGGSLIIDIEQAGYKSHRKLAPQQDREHEIAIERGSKLEALLELRSGVVNSSHHQAADQIGQGLRVSAWSIDGIIEAMEPLDDTPMLFVQWHPERMRDITNPFSVRIRSWLLDAASRFLITERR